MMRSAKKWRALGDIGDAYRTRQFVDNQFVDGSSADPSSTKPRWLNWSYGVSRRHREKWRAQVHSGRSQTERATPSLGLARAEPGPTTGISLITGCAALARKSRQQKGLNSCWRLKASRCLKEGGIRDRPTFYHSHRWPRTRGIGQCRGGT